MSNDNLHDFGRSPFVEDAFVRVDRVGRVLQASRGAAAFLGRSNESITGRSIWDLLSGPVEEKLREKVMRAESEQAHDFVESFDAHFGIWVEYHLCPLEDGFLMMVLNVTARQRSYTGSKEAQSGREQKLEAEIKEAAEEKDRLASAQDNLKMALAAAHMATVAFDLISGTFSFSDSIQEVLGVPPDQAPRTPEDLPEWVVPEDYEAHMGRVEAAVNAGGEYVSEFRMRNPKTGEVRWIENRGQTQKDDNGRPVRVYGIVQDTTERKHLQDELERRVAERTAELNAANRVLRDSEQRVRMALRNAPITMSMVDRDLRYKWLHHPLLPNSEKYLGQTAESFLPPVQSALLNGIRRVVMSTGVSTRREIYLTVAGRDICYDMIMEPLTNETGEIDGVTTVALDITERKKSEASLRALNSALERRAEQLRRLSIELTRAEERERRRIAQILHDHLQQLLVGIKFASEAMSSRTSDETMLSGLREINGLLDQSIAASRSLTAELVPPMLYEKGLPDALHWLVRWMQEKYGIEVELQADERREELAQEIRVMLFQCIKELLFNVAKHAQVKRANLTLCYGDDNMVAAQVQDEGVGFDPLAQAESAGSASGGFGLIALRERLSTIGGNLEINSSPGSGTRTIIRVPVRFEPAGPVFEPNPIPSSTQLKTAELTAMPGRRRVLVVDDHAIVRQGIARMLRESPEIDVVGEAEDGYDAVELTRSLHPDVIIMDVNMPKMNGIEATRIIHQEQPAVRIVGLSMYSSSDAGRAMSEAGAAAFLAKGAPIEELLSTISSQPQ